MIPKASVRKFIERKRHDFRPYKKLTHAQCDAVVAQFPIKPPIWGRLRLHQKICFIIGVQEKRFGFWLDLGMGKTYLSVALLRYFRKLGVSKRNLFLVPRKVNKFEIAADIRERSPTTSVLVLTGSSKNKWHQLTFSGKETIVIETYAGLVRMVCELVVPKRGKGKRKRLQPVPRLIKALIQEFKGIVLDESTLVQNKRALAWRVCKQIAKNAELVFTLTGTPFGRDPKMLWGQFHLIDNGHTLGETLGLFREALYSKSENAFGFYDYTFKKQNRKLLNRFAAAKAIRFKADEGDLPKEVSIVKHVSLGSDARAYYEKAKQAIIAAHGNYQEQKNAFLRMRQISSGFLGYKDDETGERAQYVFPQNPKLELLLSQVEVVCEESKLVVFHEYIKSGDMIAAALDKMGVGHLRLYGGTKDHDAVMEQFYRDERYRVMLVNNSIGAYGLNRLRVAQYGTYYESPVSPIIREQTKRRVRRQGSTHERVFITDLVVRGTVDQQILDALADGRDLFASIVEGVN